VPYDTAGMVDDGTCTEAEQVKVTVIKVPSDEG
jgi:hypothetical protein